MEPHLDSVDPLQAEGKLAGNEVPYSHLSTPSSKGRTQDTSKHLQLFDFLVRNWILHPGLPGAQLAHCTQEGDDGTVEQCQSTVCTFTRESGLEALLLSST